MGRVKNIRALLAHPPEDASEIKTALEERGYEVTMVHSATQALVKVAAERFDCVISSYTLSGDDGFSLLEGVCEIDEEMPSILFDETKGFEIEEAFNAGVDRFVGRNGPASLDRLAETVAEITADLVDHPERRDITGHEPEAEEIVRAIDKSTVGMSLTDPSLPDNPVVYVNDAWEQITGYESGEILGRNLRLLQGPETNPQSVQAVARAVENETSVTVELRNYRSDGSPFWNELTVAPIRNENGEIANYVAFQNDVTDRKKAEQLAAERANRLQDEKEMLRRTLGRVNGLLRQISQVLIEQNERPIVAQKICDEIVEAEGYTACWIGSTDPTDDTVIFDATAGFPGDPPTDLSLEALPDPALESLESGQIAVCLTDICDIGHLCPDEAGVRRFAAVPLVYDKKRYGLIGVYGDSPDVLDRREQQLFESIGKMIASRLNAIQTAEILTADSVLEVKVGVKDESFPLSQIAAELGATVEYVGLTNGGDAQTYELFLTATDCGNLTTLSTLSFVEDVREISETGTACTFALTVETPAPFHQLADHGASVVQLTAEPRRSILELELPPEHDVRSIVEILKRRYDGVDLRSRRERQSREQTTYEFSSRVEEKLTDRQRATLEAAHMNGYFEWPRPTDGSEIAESMDVTRQTFHQHLRAAERKLIETYVEFRSEDTYDENGTVDTDTLRTGHSQP